MKLPNLVIGGLVALGLLAGSYLFGRWDAPDRSDQVTASLLDGIKGYKALLDQLVKEKAQETKAKQAALARAGKAEAESDSIHKSREPLPIPTTEQARSCGGWIRNLDRCDEEQLRLKTSLRETRGALEATARLQALAEQGQKASDTRADSATKALQHEVGKGKILGIKLPSRRTSYVAGGVTGIVLCFLFCPKK